MNAKRRVRRAGPIVREEKRLPAASFTLFNSANVSQINPTFGSSLTPVPGFRHRLPESVPAKSSSLWSSNFEKCSVRDCR